MATAQGRIGDELKAVTGHKRVALAQDLYEGGQTGIETRYHYLDQPDGRH